MQCRDCGYFGNDKSCPLCFSAGGIHFVGPLPAPKSREPIPPAYWVLLATGVLLVCMIAGGVLFSHMHAPGAASAAIVSPAPVADVAEPVPAVTPVDAVSNVALGFFNAIFAFMYILCVVIPGIIAFLVIGIKTLVMWRRMDEDQRKQKSGVLIALLLLILLSPVITSLRYSFLLVLLIPVAGWLYYIFAVTKLGQQLDRTCDDIHTIAQNSRHDGF